MILHAICMANVPPMAVSLHMAYFIPMVDIMPNWGSNGISVAAFCLPI